MTTQDYRCSIEVTVSKAEAFDKIARVSEWWAENFTGSARKLGDTFAVRMGETSVEFEITEAVPDEKIVWHVADCYLHWLSDKNEWTGTDVIWELSSGNGVTTIDMTHRGLVPGVECYNDCRMGWDHHVRVSLYKFITEGKGFGEREKPCRSEVELQASA